MNIINARYFVSLESIVFESASAAPSAEVGVDRSIEHSTSETNLL